MERLYGLGIIDATWKCLQCLAVDHGRTYGDLVRPVRELCYKNEYEQRRLEKKRKAPNLAGLVAMREKFQDDDTKSVAVAAERLLQALRVDAASTQQSWNMAQSSSSTSF